VDWDIEVKLHELEMSVIIYQEHCEWLEKENDELKQQVIFLKEQLEYKTMGKPDNNEI
jgi:hypothetical protein|tara:strand:+ start:127 stop:300 length:174 start_codon:yes stop_codon:yes gene_type:complete